MWGLNKDNSFVLMPKTYFNLRRYMILHVFLIKFKYGFIPYVVVHEIMGFSMFYKFELHEYVDIIMHKAEISRF